MARTVSEARNMKRLMPLLLLIAATASARAAEPLSVFACEPEWAALVRELGGERVTVTSATSAQQDPHRIEARPSLIARVRGAQLVACTGAGLEAGWLPTLLRQSANPAVQPGRAGYFEAASAVTLIDVPASVDPALGDLHPEGNPHLHLDPRNVRAVAVVLTQRLIEIDAAGASYYAARGRDFLRRWDEAMRRWQALAPGLRGMPVVTHHRGFRYLARWLDLKELGELEPRPGVPPSAAHLAELVAQARQTPPRAILRAPYEPAQASAWLAARTQAKPLVLSYTVGGNAAAGDLFALFDDTLRQLSEASR
jgi:zinc/manganese transport system substrate-binding protein